jgi:hypothetical protein
MLDADVLLTVHAPAASTADVAPDLAAGIRVIHDSFGEGQVVERSDNSILVLFDEAGYRQIDVATALERGFLRAVAA